MPCSFYFHSLSLESCLATTPPIQSLSTLIGKILIVHNSFVVCDSCNFMIMILIESPYYSGDSGNHKLLSAVTKHSMLNEQRNLLKLSQVKRGYAINQCMNVSKRNKGGKENPTQVQDRRSHSRCCLEKLQNNRIRILLNSYSIFQSKAIKHSLETWVPEDHHSPSQSTQSQ